MSSDQYDADYFLRGKQTGKSLYEDYRWLPELTMPMAQAIVDHCGIERGKLILDFGCARGYVVKALRGLGHDAHGFDTSEWAIENADQEVVGFVSRKEEDTFPNGQHDWDWIIAKDVLEHVPYVAYAITRLMNAADIGVFAVIPLSEFENCQYVIREYEQDVTHIQRKPLVSWAKMFIRPGWRVDVSYRVPGIKDNWYKPGWEKGNGFITARRI